MAKTTNNETIQEVIGSFIFTERKKQGLSMAQLSVKAFGSNAYATRISDIEKAKHLGCSIATISTILAGLGYDMRDLFKN
ncbi:MAG TPA: helix-turn-helix domain-containing protein [Flavobacterium sp.]